MSLDYTFISPISGRVPVDAAIANAETVLQIIGSTVNSYRVIAAQITIIAAATSDRTHTLKVQASNTSGSFSSPISLGSISIATTDAAGTVKTLAVDVSDGQLAPGQLVRLVHSANGTDATLAYSYELIATARYC